jgi:hypothetical protein
MKLPVYFEKDGKYAALLPATDGGMIEIIDPGSSIADFMQEGSMIIFKELPKGFQESVQEALEEDKTNI